MITDIYLVYNDDSQLRKIRSAYTLKASPFFHFIDDRTKEGKKESFKLKGSWGARLTPFALCTEGDNAVKAFYSETGEDIIESLINYLNA